MTTFPVALSEAPNTLMWAEEESIEPEAVFQLRQVANLPWTRGVRVMPDVHVGKGATVGSVIAMEQAVAPAAVGVDIGCGMTAVRTNLTPEQLPDDVETLRLGIERGIPVGFAMHRDEPRTVGLHADLGERYREAMCGYHSLRAHEMTSRRTNRAKDEARAMQQVGTLGGGNHFVELCAGDDGRIWVTLHSGSRGTGNILATVHMDAAQHLAHNQDLPNRDLAVFLAGTPQMEAYLHDLWWAQSYALLNRDVILTTVCDELTHRFEGITFDEPIRCHHNYVAVETYGGTELIVTRKGAIRAGQGDLAIIPGSMGTGSYVVRGLGNEASFMSASHGAGRTMSRAKAKRTFTTADLEAQTAGIACRKDAGVLDEIPAAYKDINQVMAAQRDLVDVVARLNTLLCIKG